MFYKNQSCNFWSIKGSLFQTIMTRYQNIKQIVVLCFTLIQGISSQVIARYPQSTWWSNRTTFYSQKIYCFPYAVGHPSCSRTSMYLYDMRYTPPTNRADKVGYYIDESPCYAQNLVPDWGGASFDILTLKSGECKQCPGGTYIYTKCTPEWNWEYWKWIMRGDNCDSRWIIPKPYEDCSTCIDTPYEVRHCADCPDDLPLSVKGDNTGVGKCFFDCPNGMYAVDGKSCEVQCPPGYRAVQNSVRRTCAQCGEGQYQDAAGQIGCLPCAFGTYQDENGQTECKGCTPGNYLNVNNTCQHCGRGKYQDEPNQVACKNCPDATPFSDDSSSSTADCVATCPQNYKVVENNCQKCPNMWYSMPGNVEKVCKYNSPTCRAGEEPDDGGVCQTCPNGKASEHANNNDCGACPAGTFWDGGLKCEPCPMGTHSNTWGFNTGCAPCAVGKFKKMASSAPCEDCIVGFYSGGSSDRTKCERDAASCYQLHMSIDVTRCTSCAAGFYTLETNTNEDQVARTRVPTSKDQAICQACPDGSIFHTEYIVGGKESGACLQCRPGKYQHADGTCRECEANYNQYQDEYALQLFHQT